MTAPFFRRILAAALTLTALFPCAVSHAQQGDAPAAVSLTSLDLSQAKQGWGKPTIDQTVENHPLTLHGQVFAHGFGTHSPGTLAIQTGGAATRFTATVGIDDETGGKGSAEFEVLGDNNRILWRSGVMRSGVEPKSVNIDLTGVQRVVLRVTEGGDGFDYDHADWANANFTVKAGTAAHLSTVALSTIEPQIAMSPLAGDKALLAAQNALVSRVGTGIARTPPMGWNSYDAFGDNVTETETLSNAAYVRDKMLPFGWNIVVVDYRWYDPGAHDNNANARAGAPLTMDGFGRLLPSPNRFPSAGASGTEGFKALAAKIHAMGLRFGIHIMRGIPRNAVAANLPIDGSPYKASDAADTTDKCPWCPDMYGVRGDTPAGRAYYASLIRQYAAWGVDFIKMDDTSRPYHTHEIDAVHDAIVASGRPIVYSLSPGETPLADAGHVAGHANMWRVADDFWDEWHLLDYEFTLANRWQGVGGPGHWPDADMLPVGHLSVDHRSVREDRRTHFTHAEQMTLVSLWSLLPSPLMVGANLPDNDAWTLALLTNHDVLALDRDPDGVPAKRSAQTDETEVWTRPLHGGDRAVGLFNRSDMDTTVHFDATTLGAKSGEHWTLRDLWLRKDLGKLADGGYTATVPAHGVVLLRVMRAR